MDSSYDRYVLVAKKEIPVPPPLPCLATVSCHQKGFVKNIPSVRGHCCVSTAARDLWECLFNEGYRADVVINTDNSGVLYAHASILGMASPVIKGMLRKAKKHGHQRLISIHGVPHDAVRIFIRFLYSSCYKKEEMEEFVLPLLVLSHVYMVPQLKQLCEWQLERGSLTTDNVVDVFQLALLCDAPRLSLICHRMILKNFKVISTTDGWSAMKQSHPKLESEILLSMIDEENSKKERIRELEEKKMYLQLYEAMEALVHICRDGCKTIGPHDKDLNEDQAPCNFAACRGLELLVRHFASCKLRVPGGCVHCKRTWQLLELHSRLCSDSEVCRVPLCRNLKDKIKKQGKKDEIRWRILVKNILRAKTIGRSPFFVSIYD
ncbi:hypothetical protein HS088_TW14G00357 [Tripterygium wilfordii]|uniref:BTB/POZ and TAZ domain-containing protein 4 n=1 Tax=Tripterygium wilfordii TaxID=458696 RepID=A0A7J7CQ91_TRIWF|nr:BTB/POZ and TAZ domain-containing protein 4 [Tripterygium wilfordii]XP_038722928.1 BTB/POZ and TAZ domain-containing protein 4 [Tripterygium wilfordii]KAF5736221.1 hypothetical protein HS088_TW14G00357 [Tripterygium wilfordii]